MFTGAGVQGRSAAEETVVKTRGTGGFSWFPGGGGLAGGAAQSETTGT